MSELLLIERQPLGHGFAEYWRLNAPATPLLHNSINLAK